MKLRRRIQQDAAGCILTDRLDFEPRIAWMTAILARIVYATFLRRQRALRARFGGQLLPSP